MSSQEDFNIIFTDLDGTLIKNNIEREFLLFLLRDDKSLFAKLVFNSIAHFFLKFFKTIIQKKVVNIKYFYKGMDSSLLDEKVSLFYSNKNDNLLWNETIINTIDKDKDILIILTTSPEFISKQICKHPLKKYNWLLYGTKLGLKDGSFNGDIKIKMVSHSKRKVCQSLIFNKSNIKIKSRGYGNSKVDQGFLSIVDSPFSVGTILTSNGKKINPIKTRWVPTSYV